jgi:hypothetical protein
VTSFSDNLDGVAGALLTQRAGWQYGISGVDSDAILADGGSGFRGSTTASATQVIQPTSQPTGADQFAEALLPTTSIGPYPLGVRINYGTQVGGYFVRLSSTSATGLQLVRRSTSALTSSAMTTLGTGSGANTSTPCRLVAKGNQVWVEQGGVVLIGPVTDTNFSAGKVGIFMRGPGVAGAGAHFDNWISGDVTANAYTLTAAAGTLTLTGRAVGLKIDRRLPAAVASFALAGQNAALRASRRLPAANAAPPPANFALTGMPATLKIGRRLGADAGVIALVAPPTGLLLARRLVVDGALFALSGADAQLRLGQLVGPVPAEQIIVIRARARTIAADRRPRAIVTKGRPRTLTI